jgi:hypothetical protein
MRQPYPLQWPPGWDRTSRQDREVARFRIGMADALDDLLHELDLLDAHSVVITSDLPVSGRTGLPYANGRADDPGVAVWCVVGGKERVFACDRWDEPADNVRAIGKTIEALRGIERWGAADMVTRAFQGFAALPPAPVAPDVPRNACPDCTNGDDDMPADRTACKTCNGDGVIAQTLAPATGQRPWRAVLGFGPGLIASPLRAFGPGARRRIRDVYRQAMKVAHPDSGGTHARATELNVALREAEDELTKAGM